MIETSAGLICNCCCNRSRLNSAVRIDGQHLRAEPISRKETHCLQNAFVFRRARQHVIAPAIRRARDPLEAVAELRSDIGVAFCAPVAFPVGALAAV
jgi:hypothetical protein